MRRVLMFSLLLCPLILRAQQQPVWLDADMRSLEYPADEWYTDVVPIDVGRDGLEKATSRAKQAAIGGLSTKIRARVNSRKISVTSSRGSSNDEQLAFSFDAATRTVSQTDIAGLRTETYHHAKEGVVYGFAYIRRSDLAAYYRSQIALHLGNIEGMLQTARTLAGQGEKTKAREQYQKAETMMGKVHDAQNLLAAVDIHADNGTLQMQRSQALAQQLTIMLNAAENSNRVFVQCPDCDANATSVAEQVQAALGEGGCSCSFADSAADADMVITLAPKFNRCNEAPDGSRQVFCTATASVSVFNTVSRKTLKPQIGTVKGGWTQGNEAKAIEKTQEKLAKEIAAKLLPYFTIYN